MIAYILLVLHGDGRGWLARQLFVEGVGAYDRRADSLQPKCSEGIRSERGVEPSHDALDAEDVFGDVARHDVAIVPLCRGKERVSTLDSGALQDLLIGGITHDSRTPELGPQPVEG